MQRFAVKRQRGHDGNFALDQFLHKGMLFKYGSIRPAQWTVEFRHQRCAFFHADLIDAVLVAIERKQTPIAAQTDAFQRIQYAIRGECRKIIWRIFKHYENGILGVYPFRPSCEAKDGRTIGYRPRPPKRCTAGLPLLPGLLGCAGGAVARPCGWPRPERWPPPRFCPFKIGSALMRGSGSKPGICTTGISRLIRRSMSCSNLCSSMHTSELASPSLPARPVRPMRWT